MGFNTAGQSIIFNVSAAIGGIAAAGLAIHVVVDVGLRASGHPALGTIEFVQFIYMPLVSVGGVAAAQQGFRHISVDVLRRWLGGAVFAASQVIILLAVLGVAIALAVAMGQAALESFGLNEVGIISKVPLWIGKVSLSALFSVLAVTVLFLLFDKKTYLDADAADGIESLTIETQAS